MYDPDFIDKKGGSDEWQSAKYSGFHVIRECKSQARMKNGREDRTNLFKQQKKCSRKKV